MLASWFHRALVRPVPLASMPGLAPAGDLLFFASPKKPKEKKGDPQSGPLRGSLRKLKEPENLETSRLRRRRTSKFFNPSLPTFSSPARTGWGIEVKLKVTCKRFALTCSPNPNLLPKPVLAEPSSADGGGTSGQTCLSAASCLDRRWNRAAQVARSAA